MKRVGVVVILISLVMIAVFVLSLFNGMPIGAVVAGEALAANGKARPFVSCTGMPQQIVDKVCVAHSDFLDQIEAAGIACDRSKEYLYAQIMQQRGRLQVLRCDKVVLLETSCFTESPDNILVKGRHWSIDATVHC